MRLVLTKHLPGMKSLLVGLVTLCAVSVFANRTSDRTVKEYFGLSFPDGTIVMVFYPDSQERPMSDVQERFKAAWQWFNTQGK